VADQNGIIHASFHPTPGRSFETGDTLTITALLGDKMPGMWKLTAPPPPPAGGGAQDGGFEECGENQRGVDTGECLECAPVPTISEWGLVILTLLLLTGAKVYFLNRKQATTA